MEFRIVFTIVNQSSKARKLPLLQGSPVFWGLGANKRSSKYIVSIVRLK
jgi:hypothetical protein